MIDDSTLMRRILRQHLEGGGFEVEDWLPLSPMEIPDRLAEHPVDLILSDYQMPGLNGLSVAKMAMRAAPTVPVLILTALRDPEIEAQLEKFKVRKVLHKPISADDLLKAVREFLGT